MRTSSRLLAEIAVVTLTAVTGCSVNTGRQPATQPSPPASASTATPTSTQEATMNPIRITVDGRTIDAELNDTPAARDLLTMLPATLSFKDFGGHEKTARLPRALAMDEMPAGDDPAANEIGYYAPDRVLVLYYEDIGYFSGIVRLGRITADDMAFLKTQPDGFEVTIAAR